MSATDNARINSITLKNIKSFSEGTLCFEDGVTVISGENGAGKSTVFEALGYCLFGVDTKSFIGKADHFVRENASSGEVTVEYTGKDGKLYRVVRKTKKGGTSIDVFGEDGWFPLEGIGNPHEMIRKSLGLRSSTALSQQFEDIIGPFQSDFITPFTLTGKNREDRFDKILGIDRWRDLYKNTSTWGREINRKITDIDREINNRTEAITDLPVLMENEKNLKSSLETISQEIKKLNSSFEELENQKNQLESLQKNVAKLESKLLSAKEKKTGKEEILAEIAGKIEKSEQSKKIISKTKSAHDIYVESRKLREKLEQDRKKRDRLNDKLNEVSQYIIRQQTRLESESKNIASRQKELETRQKTIEKDLKDKAALLESAKTETSSAAEKLAEAEKSREEFNGSASPVEEIKRRKLEAESLLSYIREIENAVRERTDKVKAIPELEKSVDMMNKLEQEISNVRETLTLSRHEINEKKKGLSLLKEGVCPYFNEYCLNLEEKDPDTYFRGRISELKADIKENELDLAEKEQEMVKVRQDQQILASLKHIRSELETDRKKLESQAAKIRDIFHRSDIDDLHFSFTRTVKFKNEDITLILGKLEKNLSEFSIPDNYHEIPESLNHLTEMFSEAAGAISDITAKTVKKLEEEFRSTSRKEADISGDMNRLYEKKKETEEELLLLSRRETELVKDRKEIISRETEKENIYSEIVQFKNLDHQFDEVCKKMEENLESFDAYKEHEKTASEHDILLKRREELILEKKALEKEIDDISAESDILRKSFDEEVLNEVRSKLFETGKNRASFEERLKSVEKEISFCREQIDKKSRIKDEIIRFEKDRKEWEETRNFADFLRSRVFNRIASNVAEVLRERISETANNIYRVISGKNEELFWGDEYSIKLIDIVEGRKRERADKQLSGGQFMSAVIALRLALLQTVGSPFAFFDEPTSHLDEERRRNLAEAFRTINTGARNWYRQLFLVSHDESFQDISGNLVELALDDKRCTRVINPSVMPSKLNFIRVSVEQ
jgi:DNA repair protein SbcC/Rad50